MKKKIITLLMAAVVMSAALSGCGDTAVEEPTPVAEDKEPVPEEETPETEVEETEITEETEAEEEPVQEEKYLNLLRTEYHADGSVKDVTKYIYDESGNMTKDISYAADGSIESYVEYENDTDGNCIKSTTYDADGKVIESDESKYDSNNNYLGSTTYDSDGNITDSREYEFDDNGNEVEETYVSTFEFDGISTTLKGVYKYEYDDKNRRTKWISYGEDETTVTNIYEYAYDDAGNEITMTEYDADGSVISVQNKEYDSDNNLIKDATSNADGTVFMLHEYEYDNHGNRVKESRNYYSLGSNSLVEYEYDANDRLVKTTSYSNGEITSISSTEYDEHGNAVKLVHNESDNDGSSGLFAPIVENRYIELQDYLASKESIDKQEIEIVNTEPLENILSDAGTSNMETESTEDEGTENSTSGTENTSLESNSGAWVNSTSENIILGDDEYKGDDPYDTGDTTGYTVGY